MPPHTHKGFTTFRLWSPNADEVILRLLNSSQPEDHRMKVEGNGYHSLTLPCGHGQLYQYVPHDKPLPDSSSAFQPEGVHSPSRVVDFESFAAKEAADAVWSGIAKEDLIIIYDIIGNRPHGKRVRH